LSIRGVVPLTALVGQQMIRERLLATLSTFFAVVALLLAGIGLYGVLNQAVVRQRREIGIRMALGAGAIHLVRQITMTVAAIVGIGSMLGLSAGIVLGPVVQALLFEVTPTDPMSVIAPLVALTAAAALAAFPPAIRAVRIDPAQTLRTE
jgi:ABC-type antimicrobial peptide transport system permease subunit